MNTKRNWTQVAVVVVLALSSFSPVAVAADLCGVPNVSQWDQYMAAADWAERGGPVPLALTANCVEDSSDFAASLADLSGDSGERWLQYMAAIEGRELTVNAAPTHAATGGPNAFEQYQAAIGWAERGGQVPQALTVSGAEVSLDFVASHAGDGGDGWARFEQYMAAIEGRELTVNAAPTHTAAGGPNTFDQYQAAIEWAERGGKVPQALTVSGGEANLNVVVPFADPGGDSWARFEQYMAAIGR